MSCCVPLHQIYISMSRQSDYSDVELSCNNKQGSTFQLISVRSCHRKPLLINREELNGHFPNDRRTLTIVQVQPWHDDLLLVAIPRIFCLPSEMWDAQFNLVTTWRTSWWEIYTDVMTICIQNLSSPAQLVLMSWGECDNVSTCGYSGRQCKVKFPSRRLSIIWLTF